MLRQVRKLFKGTFWLRKLLGILPKNIRFALFRRFVSLNYLPDDQLELKVADEKNELKQAFTLLHDAYVHNGFMEKSESGMRITPYHALPSTTTLIAKFDGEVVATLSIVRKSSYGFPLEALFDVSEYESYGTRIAEISSLAVKKEFRGKGGDILWSLLKFMYEYCIKYFGIDFLMIAVNPKNIEFYEALMFFELLNDGEVYKYDFVKGVDAVGGVLDLRYAYTMFASVYHKKSPEKNLFKYFTEVEFENFKFPDRKYFKTSDPVMTPELLKYFFIEKTNLFKELPVEKVRQIASQYQLDRYSDVFDIKHLEDRRSERSIRYDVRCKARILIDGGVREVRLEVFDVSRKGFKAKLEESIRTGSVYAVQILIGEFEMAELEAFPLWDNGSDIFGFVISKSCEKWEKFISYLEESSENNPEIRAGIMGVV